MTDPDDAALLYDVRQVPRVLLARDPRSLRDVVTALQLISDLAGVHVLNSSIKHLKELGVPIPKGVRGHKTVLKDAFAVGNFYFLERGVMFPDNVITACESCRHPLQFRPNLGYHPNVKLCPYCAVDRLLEAHWSKKKADG